MKNILTSTIGIASLFLAADSGANATTGTGTEAPAAPAVPTGPQTAAEFLALHPIVETAYIEVKKIVIDAGTQPRVAIDDDVVKEYAETIKTAIKDEQPNPFDNLPDDKLPQVFRDSTGRCVLADGFHRYGGHKGAHAKEMKVAIRAGSERDALVFSLGTNQEHGVRRTNRDKARAVKIAFTMPEVKDWANTDIARLCGVSEFMVREARPAKAAAATRQVTIRGKKTTMKTSAIGKGKGGGAKGKKAAAKGKGASGTPTTPPPDAAAELDAHLRKIAEACGTAGGEFRKAVNAGTLEISAREVRDFAGFDTKVMKRVLPLVTGGLRMKPTKAFEFIQSALNPKFVAEVENRALAEGGKYEFENDTVKIVVTRKSK